jgi:hypothetical protein
MNTQYDIYRSLKKWCMEGNKKVSHILKANIQAMAMKLCFYFIYTWSVIFDVMQWLVFILAAYNTRDVT